MKRFLKQRLLRYLFKTVTDSDVIPWSRLTEEQQAQFAIEARMLTQNKFWERSLHNLRWSAQKQMFEKSKDSEELLFGKAVLYVVDILEQKAEKIAKLDKVAKPSKN